MNDLAEKALHGIDVARRKVGQRPMLAFGVFGFALSSVIVVAGGRVVAAQPTRPLTSWFGLQDAHGARAGDQGPGLIMLVAILALVLTWIGAAEFVRRVGTTEGRIWSVAAAWAMPFALGPPLMDTTIYRYTAFGLLQRHALSPYDFGPSRLGGDQIVAAVDPSVRGTPSGVGPLGTLLQHLSVSISGGSPLGAVVVLRIIGVLAAVAIAALATDLAAAHRPRALTLAALNPLVLLYVVSAGHLDGVMIALVLAALRAAGRRRWVPAIVFACLAGSVDGMAFLALPAILAVHWLGRGRAATWRLLGRDLVIAAATIGLVGLVVSDGFGWLWTVNKQFAAHPPFSIASGIAKLLTPVVRGASYDDLAAGARITVITAMICVVTYLVATARQRALERTVGYSLLAVALLAPLLYPWYLLWGVACVIPAAAGLRRIAVLALCSVGCLLMPVGFSSMTANVIAGCALAVAAVATVVALELRRRSLAQADPARMRRATQSR